ncbi:MAG: hypothetical protein IPG89_18210 [Bacteroidetes bacterium]|nr:hypothetical protein [Bacteroidota bacterium]
MIQENEIINNLSFFQKCEADHQILAENLINELACLLEVEIDPKLPLNTFKPFFSTKQSGEMNGWNYFLHGYHCCFENINTKQKIEVSLVDKNNFRALDPIFFLNYILSTPKYQPLPFEILPTYETGKNILNILKFKMTPQVNNTLPFFSYGFFRPGEISFLGIKDFVSSAKAITIEGDLVLRDGVTLFKDSKNQTVSGYLITFKPKFANDAYSFINSLEPKKLFKWKEKKTDDISFNILYGVKPDRGSDDIREADWKTIWDDPFFTSALEVLSEMPNEKFEWNLKPLFKLQMKYMLLWTILERFSFLRYSFGGGPSTRNRLLAENKYYKEALLEFVFSERTIYSSEDPDDKTILSAQNPIKSLDYYYQVRCNITHRGKAVTRDHETVEKSYNELFEITKYILNKTKQECSLIKKEYETGKN